MLKNIKKLINEQKSMLEAANLIAEETSSDNIDDLIVLGESSDNESDTSEDNEDFDSTEFEEENNEDESEEESSESEEEDEEEVPEEDEEEPELPNNDIMNDDIDSEVPEDSSLPEVIGAQTGEPASMSINDILTTEIDLTTNTPKDTLPIPPAGAVDVVPDEDNDSIMSQRIDSGFENPPQPEDQSIGSEEPELPNNDIMNDDIDSEVPEDSSLPEEDKSESENNIMNEEMSEDEETPKTEEGEADIPESNDEQNDEGDIEESFNILNMDIISLSEAITIGDDNNDSNDSNDDSEEGNNEEENSVTSAVRDKVAEAGGGDNEEETSEEGDNDEVNLDGLDDFEDEENGDAFNDEGSSNEEGKAKVMEELSKVTKSLEDVKNTIMQSIY